jgi:choice-of-anchor A domain-containing protein
MQNLGEGFSEATGNPHFSRTCYPAVTGLKANNLPGRDDSVAVFVAGNFQSIHGAEVEGNTVVLGNLDIEHSGSSNFVSVGAGTHVLPNSGGDCVIVGGNIKVDTNVQVFNQVSSMKCDLVYRGKHTNIENWKTNGSYRKEPNYDISKYEKMAVVLRNKSQYWKTLPSNSIVRDSYGETQFGCKGNEPISVFNIHENDYDLLSKPHTYRFTNTCDNKSILINVHGTGDIKVTAAAMFFKNKAGFGPGGFSTCLTQNILWNFPDASSVDIGAGRTSEFHGSILAGGDMYFTTTGHSGRTMVLGDLYQDKGGSEFHTYQYAPPTALPDPDNVCTAGAASEAVASFEATQAEVTAAAMEAPDPAQEPGCKAKPNNNGVNDGNCKRCESGYKYWPCNTVHCQGLDC